jgi:hypothetical protein
LKREKNYSVTGSSLALKIFSENSSTVPNRRILHHLSVLLIKKKKNPLAKKYSNADGCIVLVT